MAPGSDDNLSFSTEDLPELLTQYYRRMFPYEQFFNWLSYNIPHYFSRREFSFTLKDDVYVRYQSFEDQQEMEKEIQKKQPYKIDIGAVYTQKPKDRKTVKESMFIAKEKELVFDIDMTDYDEVRNCCSGASICNQCWPLMSLAIKILDKALNEDFGFKNRLWVYSGRRGVHCWVCDEDARKLSQAGRSAIAEYLSLIKGGEHQLKKVNFGRSIHPSIARSLPLVNEFFTTKFLEEQGVLDSQENWKKVLAIVPDENIRETLNNLWLKHSSDITGKQKWNELCKELDKNLNFGKKVADEIMFQYVYPRLDVNVSKGLNHLLKSPFCVHPKTGRVCVPINTKKVDDFDPFKVPTISQLCEEIDRYDENAKKQKMDDEVSADEVKVQKNSDIKDYKKTSLLESIKHFQAFINNMKIDHDVAKQKQISNKKRGHPASLAW